MKRHRLRRTVIGVVVATLALALVATAAMGRPQRSSETTTVRLGVFANVTHAPGLVAIESGLLQEELGPDVGSVQYFNAGPAVITALLAGDRRELHRTQPGDHRLRRVGRRGAAHHLRLDLRGRARGEPEITKVSQLEGKKIATPQLGNTQDVAARAYFASKGLETDVGRR